MPALSVRDVHVSYGKVRALRGVSLDVDEGQIVAIVGANGAGKSTILKAVMGLVPIASGEVWFGDRRLDRLSARCRAVLGIGALLGRDLDLGVMARVAALPREEVLALLDEALAADVVRTAGGTHRFSHPLVREALAEDQLSAERARLHRRIGEALEAMHQGDLDPHLARLAEHFCAAAPGGGIEPALRYARLAGERAARLLACDEAVVHYRRALEVQALAGEPDERLRGDLLLALGEAQLAAGQAAEGRETLARAAAAARRLGSGEHLARVALAQGGLVLSTEVGVDDPGLVTLLEEALAALPAGDSALRVRLLVRLALALPWSLASDRTASLAAEAVAMARRLDDPVALGYALYAHRWTLLGPAEVEAKLAGSDEMLGLARRARHGELELAARSCRLLDLTEIGRLGEADRECAAFERLAAGVRVPRYRWRARFYRGMRVLLEGRFAEAEVLIEAALAEERRFMPRDAGLVFGVQVATLRREQGRVAELEAPLRDLADRFFTIPAWRAALALLHAETGRPHEARVVLETLAADDFRAVPRDFLWIASLALLAEVCALLGDAARARRLYERLHPHAPRTVLVGAGAACWGSLDRFLGLLAAAAGERERATRHFEAALRMDARIGARPWAGWDEWELARLASEGERPGDRERARGHLARAREVAAALGMALAERSAALAARLG